MPKDKKNRITKIGMMTKGKITSKKVRIPTNTLTGLLVCIVRDSPVLNDENKHLHLAKYLPNGLRYTPSGYKRATLGGRTNPLRETPSPPLFGAESF
jgi:hypothetical protein